MSIKEMIPMFQTETVATLYMVSISTVISYLIGIPLGVILVVTEEGNSCTPFSAFSRIFFGPSRS